MEKKNLNDSTSGKNMSTHVLRHPMLRVSQQYQQGSQPLCIDLSVRSYERT